MTSNRTGAAVQGSGVRTRSSRATSTFAGRSRNSHRRGEQRADGLSFVGYRRHGVWCLGCPPGMPDRSAGGSRRPGGSWRRVPSSRGDALSTLVSQAGHQTLDPPGLVRKGLRPPSDPGPTHWRPGQLSQHAPDNDLGVAPPRRSSMLASRMLSSIGPSSSWSTHAAPRSSHLSRPPRRHTARSRSFAGSDLSRAWSMSNLLAKALSPRDWSSSARAPPCQHG